MGLDSEPTRALAGLGNVQSDINRA